jgi:hypothetical protein
MSDENSGHPVHAAVVGAGVVVVVGALVVVVVVVVVGALVVVVVVVSVVQLAAVPLPSAFCEHMHVEHAHAAPLVTQRLRS